MKGCLFWGRRFQFALLTLFILVFSVCKDTNDTAEDAEDVIPPAEVTNLAAAAGDAQVVLTWDDPPDADFKEVEILQGAAAVTVAKGVKTKTFTGLTNGQAYAFVVKTADFTGNKSMGKAVGATPTAAPPPTGTVRFGIATDVSGDITTSTPLILEVYTDLAQAQARAPVAKVVFESETETHDVTVPAGVDLYAVGYMDLDANDVDLYDIVGEVMILQATAGAAVEKSYPAYSTGILKGSLCEIVDMADLGNILDFNYEYTGTTTIAEADTWLGFMLSEVSTFVDPNNYLYYQTSLNVSGRLIMIGLPQTAVYYVYLVLDTNRNRTPTPNDADYLTASQAVAFTPLASYMGPSSLVAEDSDFSLYTFVAP